jgi:8-oxo-dGTP diphosphatase
LVRPIRNSVKAIIIREDMLICIRGRDKAGGLFYCLPGGGQRNGESLAEALKRECREELSADVNVGDLAYIREDIGDKYGPGRHGTDWHQVEFMFRCAIADDVERETGSEPDDYQDGLEWLPLERLTELEFYPKALAPMLATGRSEPMYLGNVE